MWRAVYTCLVLQTFKERLGVAGFLVVGAQTRANELAFGACELRWVKVAVHVPHNLTGYDCASWAYSKMRGVSLGHVNFYYVAKVHVPQKKCRDHKITWGFVPSGHQNRVRVTS